MKDHKSCFRRKGLSCFADMGKGQADDTSEQGCEVAFIGRDHTFHTHMCGPEPSKADIEANRKLGRRFLCIGEDETGKIHCYDLAKDMKHMTY